MTDLKGKTVFITGAARRLGRAIALASADAGANVALTFLSSSHEADETLKEIRARGVQGIAFECDLSQAANAQGLVKSVLKQFGQIDLLINNAGVFETANFEDITVDQWDEVFAVNVRAPYLVSQSCIPGLRSSRGRIINLGSVGGEKPWATHAHYCSSKAALHMLTQVMAKALAPDIAVNCVAPGMIDSGSGEKDPALLQRVSAHTPMKKNGVPDDVVSAVMYFATAPHFITGQILTVDGGLSLR
ncbi:MAG: 3-oxoacyl-(acyl-carrier-protein) reductase [Candidatus Angelobacter sp.]|nr:3-oxoacyl-(acyl-carrier-protein) reductase [Candidatus Angelobacter sp.]